MKGQAHGTSQRVRQYLGRTLIIFQVALSLLLLIGAGLLIRSLYNLRQIDLGFRFRITCEGVGSHDRDRCSIEPHEDWEK